MKITSEKNSEFKASESVTNNGTNDNKKTTSGMSKSGTGSKPKGNAPSKKKKVKPASRAPKNLLQSARRIDLIIAKCDDFLKSQYLQFYSDMINTKLFPNPELALRRLSETVDFIKRSPHFIIHLTSEFNNHLKKDQFNTEQKIFMLEWASQLFDKLEQTEGAQFKDVSVIFQGYADSFKIKPLPKDQILSEQIIDFLKNQFELMPQLLENVPPDKRLDWILKLMQNSDVIKSVSSELPTATKNVTQFREHLRTSYPDLVDYI
ncbi:MAG: hypothetical protein KQH67_13055 [Bacteroidetes bacterium]|nr:hypothetical protein [Bacteroidota bacterium]